MLFKCHHMCPQSMNPLFSNSIITHNYNQGEPHSGKSNWASYGDVGEEVKKEYQVIDVAENCLQMWFGGNSPTFWFVYY